MKATQHSSELTLTEMFDHLNVNALYFDMGRRIQALSSQTMLKVEKQLLPYPTPYQQKMWLGLLLMEKNKPLPSATENTHQARQPLVWFLQFPLDEQGFVQVETRDRFLQQLALRLTKNADNIKQTKPLENILEGSPHVFTPREEAKAIFHAKALHSLKLPASSYHTDVKNYLQNIAETRTDHDQLWTTLGIQGFADYCARISRPGAQQLLSKALPYLQTTVLQALCCCLEHETIDSNLSNEIVQRIEILLENPDVDVQLIAALLRALSNSTEAQTRQLLLRKILLRQDIDSADIFIAIALRSWLDLRQAELAELFFRRLATRQDAGLFDTLFSDLVYIPELRVFLLALIRNPACPQEIVTAVNKLVEQRNKNST
jgi:hypothetical protein